MKLFILTLIATAVQLTVTILQATLGDSLPILIADIIVLALISAVTIQTYYVQIKWRRP